MFVSELSSLSCVCALFFVLSVGREIVTSILALLALRFVFGGKMEVLFGATGRIKDGRQRCSHKHNEGAVGGRWDIHQPMDRHLLHCYHHHTVPVECHNLQNTVTNERTIIIHHISFLSGTISELSPPKVLTMRLTAWKDVILMSFHRGWRITSDFSEGGEHIATVMCLFLLSYVMFVDLKMFSVDVISCSQIEQVFISILIYWWTIERTWLLSESFVYAQWKLSISSIGCIQNRDE